MEIKLIPELTLIESTDSKIQVIRDELAETKRMVRKTAYEIIPNIFTKLNSVESKLSTIEVKLDMLLCK